MIRRALVTVRLPGVRMAPIRRTYAQSQTRWQNSGRNARMTNASSAGIVGMKHCINYLFYTFAPFRVCMTLAHQLNDLGSRFGLSPLARSGLLHPSQMDKVELSAKYFLPTMRKKEW